MSGMYINVELLTGGYMSHKVIQVRRLSVIYVMSLCILYSLRLPAVASVSGLGISGYISPTYIYSGAQGISSFMYGNGTKPFGYYSANSAAGALYLSANEKFKNGSDIQLSFIPNVSPDAPYYIARAKVPIYDRWSAIAGLMPTWNSYDSWSSVYLPTVTRSLTVAYTIPAYMIGAGLEWSGKKRWFKVLVGNLNTPIQAYSSRPSVESIFGYHVSNKLTLWDYALYGQLNSPNGLGNVYHDDIDASYNIRNVTIGGDLFYEGWQKGAVNGGTAADYGGEVMTNYAITTKTMVTIRYDYFNDTKNGGVADISTAQSGFLPVAPNVGPTRKEVTIAAQFKVNAELITKLEYRYDWSNSDTFGLYRNEYDASKNIQYGTTNHSSLVGVQIVYEF